MLRPHDPRGTLALGEAYYHSHALSVARATLLEVVGKRATAAGASYYLGRIANDEGKWQEADRYFHNAIHYNPDYADAYAMLGGIYLHEKKYSDCVKALHLALKLDPDNYRANLWLTALYEGTKDPRAEAQAERLRRLQKARDEEAKLFLRRIRVVP